MEMEKIKVQDFETLSSDDRLAIRQARENELEKMYNNEDVAIGKIKEKIVEKEMYMNKLQALNNELNSSNVDLKCLFNDDTPSGITAMIPYIVLIVNIIIMVIVLSK